MKSHLNVKNGVFALSGGCASTSTNFFPLQTHLRSLVSKKSSVIFSFLINFLGYTTRFGGLVGVLLANSRNFFCVREDELEKFEFSGKLPNRDVPKKIVLLFSSFFRGSRTL